MSHPTASSKIGRGPLTVVFFTVFLDLLGFGIIIPIQAFYAEAFGARPAVITLIGASYSLMQFVFMPMWGRVSDRVGRRPVILFSVLISAIGFALFGLADSLWMLFVARMLAGFGNANIGAAQAVIADVTTGENRAKGMGLIGAAFGLGFILGPAVGGPLGQISMALPAFVASGLAVVNLVLAWFFLPETRRVDAPKRRGLFSRTELVAALRVRGVPRLLSLSFLIVCGFSLMEQVMGLFIERVWVPVASDATAAQVLAGHKEAALRTTWTMVAVGVTMSVVQGGLIGKLAKKFGEAQLIRAGCLLMMAGLAVVPLVGATHLFWLMFPTSVLLALGSGVTTPSLTSLLSRSVDGDHQGGTLGLGQSLSSLGRVVGPAMAGTLFESSIDLPFYVGAGLLLLSFGIAIGLRRRRAVVIEEAPIS